MARSVAETLGWEQCARAVLNFGRLVEALGFSRVAMSNHGRAEDWQRFRLPAKTRVGSLTNDWHSTVRHVDLGWTVAYARLTVPRKPGLTGLTLSFGVGLSWSDHGDRCPRVCGQDPAHGGATSTACSYLGKPAGPAMAMTAPERGPWVEFHLPCGPDDMCLSPMSCVSDMDLWEA